MGFPPHESPTTGVGQNIPLREQTKELDNNSLEVFQEFQKSLEKHSVKSDTEKLNVNDVTSQTIQRTSENFQDKQKQKEGDTPG